MIKSLEKNTNFILLYYADTVSLNIHKIYTKFAIEIFKSLISFLSFKNYFKKLIL